MTDLYSRKGIHVRDESNEAQGAAMAPFVDFAVARLDACRGAGWVVAPWQTRPQLKRRLQARHVVAPHCAPTGAPGG